MKLDDVVNHFLLDKDTSGRGKLTLRSYRQRLSMFVQFMSRDCQITELEQVKIMHLRLFVQALMKTQGYLDHPRRPKSQKMLSVSTVRAYIRVLKAFFHWCLIEDLIDINPADKLTMPKAPTYLIPTFGPEHIEKMLARCDISTPLGFRDYVLLLVLLDTGMRLSEICSLHVEDVYDRYVKVTGKGRKEREIGLHPEVSKLLWKYIHKYRAPGDPNETRVFLGRGRPLSMYGVQALMRRIKSECGFDGMKVSPHVFRHTFAKLYLQRGGEVFKLSREMGHSEVQVTETYLKDFNSTQARMEHSDFSPIGLVNLKKNGGSRRGTKK